MDSNNPSRIFYRITIEPPNIVHPYKSHEDSLNSRKNFDFPTNLNVFTPLDFLETKLSTFVNQLLDVDFFFFFVNSVLKITKKKNSNKFSKWCST